MHLASKLFMRLVSVLTRYEKLIIHYAELVFTNQHFLLINNASYLENNNIFFLFKKQRKNAIISFIKNNYCH